MKSCEPFLQWIQYSESNWYPARGQENARRKNIWRCALGWNSEATPNSFIIQQFQGHVGNSTSLMHWTRGNNVDYILCESGVAWTFLPETIDIDDSLLNVTIVHDDTSTSVQCFIAEEPQNHLDNSIFDVHLQWDSEQSYVHCNIEIAAHAHWHVCNAGQWTKQYVASMEPGVHILNIVPPIGDLVYLEVAGYRDYKHIHRLNVVGRPGIASGRYVWHRGMLYHPKGCKTLPWVSGIVPVFHISDIERFPRNSNMHQVQWWVEEAHWTDEAIAQIKASYPDADILRLGTLDKPGDIVVLRPYEVCEDLPKDQLYAVQLFENAGEEPFSRNAAWLIEKISAPALEHLKFLERAWFSALANVPNTNGSAQYGFGYAFTRNSEHEHLWSGAVRNIILREEKESLPCYLCTKKGSCKQLLPTSYFPEVQAKLTIPWQSLQRQDCVVKALI